MVYFVIGLVVIFILGVLRIYSDCKDSELQDSMSARDYWRWKNGGID